MENSENGTFPYSSTEPSFGEKLAILIKKSNPVKEYLNRPKDFPRGREYLGQGETVLIPINKFDRIRYFKENGGWDTDRDTDLYNDMIFSDEYRLIASTTEVPRHTVTRENSKPIAGGLNYALGAGRIVLDLGSGEAIALLEYSQKFPRTIFIGIDSGYDRELPVRLNKPGVQLTKDDWTTLKTLPDHCIDTILSTQGAFMWGAGAHGRETEAVVKAVTRVAKQGAVLRFDHGSSRLEWEKEDDKKVLDLLQQQGWKIHFAPETVVAIKE